MDAQAVLALLDRFFTRRFNRAAAVHDLGDVRDEKHEVVNLSPRDPDVQRARLELFEDEVVGIVLGFVAPISISVGALESRFGAATEGVRLKPEQPVPYEYGVSRDDVEGIVIVKASAAPVSFDPTTELATQGVIARRQFLG